jgi:mercuric reductase
MKYDFVILGGGAAGFSAAVKAEEFGVKTLMVNQGPIGGTCVNVGCVPSKYLLTGLELRWRALNHHYDGIELREEEFSFKRLAEGKNRLVERLRKEKYRDAIDSMDHVEYVEGKGVIRPDGRLKVNGDTIEIRKLLIATGARARILPVKGIESIKDRVLTNVEALSLKEKPESIIIMGGRTQGLEFAQIFSRAGSEVTLLQRSSRIMPKAEPELSESLRKILSEEGIRIFTGVNLKKVEKANNGIRVRSVINNTEREFESEYILFATGRKPNTDGIGLEHTDVQLNDSGFIMTDKTMKASNKIYAAGDVTGEPMLETVAAKEGSIAAINALTEKEILMDYSTVPKVVFTEPQLASVGMTDEEAIQKYTCACKTVSFTSVPKALITGDEKGLIKMVVDRDTWQILGIHILSGKAAEIIHEATMIVKNKMTVDQVIDTVHVFPTMSEAIKLVALSFRKDIGKLPCCAE